MAKARRRRFPAAEKLRILREAEGCRRPGELGTLLPREGLFSSHLAKWRAARRRGELAGLTARRRAPRAQRPDPRDRRIAELEGETRRLQARLERAEALIEVQKKKRGRNLRPGPVRINPAATYSPTALQLQYHRRWRA